MRARNQYSSINFLGGFIEGISMAIFLDDFYTVVFGCGEITSETFHDVQNANRRCTGHATMSTEGGNYRLITVHAPFPIIAPTDRRLKIQEDVLRGILPKITVHTSVTHCALIALRKFYSDHCLKPFCEFPNNISFLFLLQKNKPTQSATIVLTLWIYRAEDELQSCILVWRHAL